MPDLTAAHRADLLTELDELLPVTHGDIAAAETRARRTVGDSTAYETGTMRKAREGIAEAYLALAAAHRKYRSALLDAAQDLRRG